MRIFNDNISPTHRSKSRRVRPIAPITKVHQTRIRRNYGKPIKNRDDDPVEEVQEAVHHYDDLELEVEELQEQLDEDGRPFSVSIYKKENRVFIEIFRVDLRGRKTLLTSRDITHRDFTGWAKMIMEGEGMLFNEEG